MYWIIKFLLTVCMLIICVITDIKCKKIKNSVCALSIILGIVLNLFEFGIKGILYSILGITIPIVILYMLFLIKSLGAGDIKLFATIGSIWGANIVFYSMIFSFLIGGFIGLLISVIKKILLSGLNAFLKYIKICFITRSFPSYISSNNSKSTFCFSPAIMLGTIIAILYIGKY